MEQIIKQLKNVAKDTRLSAVEKAAIKTQLLRYVQAHPVRAEAFSSHFIPSPFNINNFRNKKTLSAFVIGGLLLGSTVSFAAENTVPGDVLYPVKIHINEQVLAVIAVTPQAKADWDVRKAERRLEEVEKLADEPTVTPEVKAAAEANFNASTNQVQEHIANFESDDDSEDAIATAEKFAEMLRKHEGNLDKRDMTRAASMIRSTSTSEASYSQATTTKEEVSSVSSFVGEKEESFDKVLKSVRGARGNAEKKQKELEQKYHKEDVQIEASVTVPVSVQSEVSRGNSYNAVNDKHGRSEEFRATPIDAAPSAQVDEQKTQPEND